LGSNVISSIWSDPIIAAAEQIYIRDPVRNLIHAFVLMETGPGNISNSLYLIVFALIYVNKNCIIAVV